MRRPCGALERRTRFHLAAELEDDQTRGDCQRPSAQLLVQGATCVDAMAYDDGVRRLLRIVCFDSPPQRVLDC